MKRPDEHWTEDTRMYDVLTRKTLYQPNQETSMAMKRLFTVFECDNGFIAEIGEAGKFGTVVGMSVSDVTAAAQTALATAKLRQDEEGEPDKQDGKDARVQKIFHSQGPPNASGFGSAGSGSGSGSGQLLDKLFTKGTP